MAQTWMARLRELERQGKRTWFDSGPLPRFVELCRQERGPAIAQAKRETGAPVAISEEWYPDFPEHFPLYVTDELGPGGLSAFWHRVHELEHAEKADCG